MKKILLLIIAVVATCIFFSVPISAQEKITVYLFKVDGCPHCVAEETFLQKLKQEIPLIEMRVFEVSKNTKNARLLKKIGEDFSINISKIPITIIGSQYFTGYENDKTTGELIKNLINQCISGRCEDPIAFIIMEEIQQENENKISQKLPETINLPFFGEMETKNVSLPLLTVIIAGIDGFNPCAMWVLIFLINLLLGMKNKRRMWILGIAFVAASGLVYFLFLSAWLNLFLFLGFVFWVRIIIGFVAIGSGIYYLKKYFTDKAATCQISKDKRQLKIFNELKNISQKKQFWTALGGIILLAAVVNLFELLCSAGLPAIYTNILTLSELSDIQYYAYLLLYILVFMLDDIAVFVIAMITLKTIGFTKKYSHVSAFIGGTIITIIGLLLIFKPEWLMFN